MDAIDIAMLLSCSNTESEKEFVFPDDLVTSEEAPLFSTHNFPWLYALAKNGNLRTYRITVCTYRDHSLLTTMKATTEGGKWQIDTYEYRSGVNIGKSNETTFSEQAMNEATSIYKKLLDKGFSPEKPKKDAKFNTDAKGFMKPMLASKFNEKGIKFPCLVQPKYDGVRCLVFEHKGEVHIISRQGKPYNIPHLKEWADNNKHLLPLDGELYNHKELTFQEIISAVKRHSDITSKIKYVVYDKPVGTLTNIERIKELDSAFEDVPKSAPVVKSPYEIVTSMEELHALHNKYVSMGYEGAIIRNFEGTYEFGFRSNNLMKLKAFDDSEFEIIDVIEASGRDSGTAVFVCRCDGGEFNVKPQGTRELRGEYLRNRRKIIGKMVTVQYQGLSDDGIPRFPSAISIRDYE